MKWMKMKSSNFKFTTTFEPIGDYRKTFITFSLFCMFQKEMICRQKREREKKYLKVFSNSKLTTSF